MATRWITRGIVLIALAMLAAGGGPTHAFAQTVDEIAALNKQASGLYQAGKYAEAVPIAERALALGQRLADPKPPEVAATLNELARLYEKQGRAAESEALYRRALAIYETANGPDDPWVAAVLHNLALLYRDQGRIAEAETPFRRALAIYEKAAGPDYAPFRAVYNELVTLYESHNRYAEADRLIKHVLSVREQALGADHPDVGLSVNELANLNFIQGHYGEAEQLYKRALSIREKALGPDSSDVAQTLNNLAVLYQGIGRYAEAEALYKRSLAIREKVLGPEHVDVANSLNTLAQLYVVLSQYEEAELLFKRSLAIFEKAYGPDHRNVGVAVGNLAVLYQTQGRSAEAEPLFKRTVTVIEKTLGPNHPYVGTALNNLAFIYDGQARYAEAEPLFKRTVAILETALGPDHPDVGTALSNLASLYGNQGRHSDGEPLLLRALAIIEKALGPDHANVGTALNNLGIHYRQQGRYAEAERTFKRMLAVTEKALGPDHPSFALGLSNLADLRLAQQDWRGATEHFRRSSSIIVRRTQRGGSDLGKPLTGKTKSEAEQGSYHFLGLVKAAYRQASEAGGADPVLRNETFQAAQWAQGSEAAASLAQMAARGARGDAALAGLARERQDLVAEWQQRDGAHTAAASQPPDKRDAGAEAANLARIAAIDARLAVIDKRLTADFPNYAALVRPEPLSIAEVQAQLGADEALVLFLNTHEVKPIPAETFLWVVTRSDSRWVRSELGPNALAENVAALRCGLDITLWSKADGWSEATEELTRQKAAQVARRQRCEALTKAAPSTQLIGLVPTEVLPFDAGRAHALYKALFGEVEGLIRGKHLLVALNGALTSLPLSVLVTEPPKEAIPAALPGYRGIAWLGTRQPVTVLPSVASLGVLRATAKPSRARHVLLGIGNPLLDGPGPRYAQLAKAARDKQACPKQPTPGERLVAVRDSVMSSFQSVFRGAQADTERVREWPPLPETADELCEIGARLRVPESDILLGARAREAAIKELSESGRLADYQIVHFATHGALAGDVKGVAEPGLILTPPDQGVRDAAALDRDDGFLTASEVAALKLDANWVIMSACNTAAGAAEHADALSGLARAFFYAGARALLVSHWEVGSQTAVALTTRAFEELTAKPGIGRAEALRISMRSLLEKGGIWQAHPSQWA
ncbi:MAG TPA: CHAT domain-containing tetratricopeptide repeat protein, partial [Hyphomicrobiaceae bacterium]|nr:CHAT domain-containing tetratricopeptide repeat protein [Hyphomicrobiaceae bacterium]